ncbi:MAG TPA: sigma-70 family RNA polymerase sigma factor [Anaerolineales bacterium]|nr:sigma-70 family RNA polymerase sigma factor [Anaerolineales bacterium]
MDEIELIEAAKGGDLDAFNRLVLAYQDQAYGVAYRIAYDPDVAADATQNAFISAYRALGGFRGGSFRAWILRIVTNACYDELRRLKRHRGIPLEPMDSEGEEIESAPWLADPSESPEETALRAELRIAIEGCIRNLPEEYRVALELVDVQGLDYAEAAEALKRPIGTIKSRMARARMRIRDCLKAYKELLPESLRLGEEIFQ